MFCWPKTVLGNFVLFSVIETFISIKKNLPIKKKKIGVGLVGKVWVEIHKVLVPFETSVTAP